MKTRKIFIGLLLVTLIAGGTTAVFAFGKRGAAGPGRFGSMGHGIPNSDMIISHLKEELQLTEEQEAQLKPVLDEQLEKWRETFKNSRGQFRKGFQDMRSTFEERWNETEQQFADILTDEQMQKIQQFKETRMGRFSKMGAGRSEKFHQFLANLNLSDEQKQELFTIFKNHHENRQDGMDVFLESHKAMTDLIIAEEFDEQKVRELFQEHAPKLEDMVVEHAKMLADMKAVLTPEQIETLQVKQTELFEEIEQWRSAHPKGHGWF